MNPGRNAGRCVLWLFLALGVFLPAQGAPARRALVIGNDSYPGNALRNARNDARSIASSLESMGYLSTLVLDVDRRGMEEAVDRFAGLLKTGDLAFIYYAGHGLQVDGENYLVPVDFHVSDETDVQYQGYALSKLLAKITEHGATTQILVLDACRDNPFLPSRSVRSGWAGIVSSAGSFIAFGTSPGSTASDDPAQGHGLFTQSLLAYLASPVEIEQMFRMVREDVIRRSGGLQVPWTASSLIGTLHVDPHADLQTPALASLDSSGDLPASATAGRQLNRSSSALPPGTSGNEAVLLSNALQEVRGLHFAKAISILEELLDLYPPSSFALRLLGASLHLVGRSTEAVDTLNRAIDLDSTDAVSYSYRCLIKLSIGAPGGQDDCRKATQLRTDLMPAYLGLAIGLAGQGQAVPAYGEATKAVGLRPDSPVALKIQARLGAERNLANVP